MTALTRTLWALLILIALCSLTIEAHATNRDNRSGLEFVENFLRWYVPRVLRSKPWTIAVTSRRTDFDPQLAKLLRENIAAQAKCRALISFDFDPFLYTQEPAERYVVGAIAQKSQSYLADIYSVRHGEQGGKPDVIWEFKYDSRQWRFVNFHFPGESGTGTIFPISYGHPSGF